MIPVTQRGMTSARWVAVDADIVRCSMVAAV
jgi:hypothetical protein